MNNSYTFYFLDETSFKNLYEDLKFENGVKNISFLGQITPNSIDPKTDMGRVSFAGSEEYTASFTRVPKMESLDNLALFYGFLQCNQDGSKIFICEHIVKMKDYDKFNRQEFEKYLNNIRLITQNCQIKKYSNINNN